MERHPGLPLAFALRACCERQTVILDYESTLSTATTRGLEGELPFHLFTPIATHDDEERIGLKGQQNLRFWPTPECHAYG